MKIFFAILILITFACSLYTPAKVGIIKYYGFDFSSGGYNKTIENNDIVLSSYNNYLIFTTSFTDTNYIKDLGPEPFNSVNINNISWDSISYVISGHLYIVKCKDGYAKFKIVSVSGSFIYNYEVQIYYEYSINSDL